MGVRALLIIRDRVAGKRDVLYRHWASPQYQVQYMATYVHDQLGAGRPVNWATLRDWIDENPDMLPAEEYKFGSDNDLHDPCDHDFRYLMQTEYPRWRYVVLARTRRDEQPWHLEFDVDNPRVLYVAAEKMARELVAGTRRTSLSEGKKDSLIGHFTAAAAQYAKWADEESSKTLAALQLPPQG